MYFRWYGSHAPTDYFRETGSILVASLKNFTLQLFQPCSPSLCWPVMPIFPSDDTPWIRMEGNTQKHENYFRTLSVV